MCEEYASGEPENIWYESDLQLAAELGKTLLERNRDLEAQVCQVQQQNSEQSVEIQFLNKQMETLRDLNESRIKIYDEVERHAIETEKNNQRLVHDSKADKEKIVRLNDTVEILENKVYELENCIQEMKKTERQRQKQEPRVRTLSVPSITDALKYNSFWTFDLHDLTGLKKLPLNPYEAEIQKLQQTVKHLRTQNVLEERRNNNLETEIGILVQENQGIEGKLKEQDHLMLKVKSLEIEIQDLESKTGKVCTTCKLKIADDLELEIEKKDKSTEISIEHDQIENIKHCEILKLKNGGSAYGSRESLNKAGLQSHDSPNSQTATLPGESLLSELNAQYMFLVRKYEAMLEVKKNATISRASSAEDISIGCEQVVFTSSAETQAGAQTTSKEVQASLPVLNSRSLKLQLNLEKRARPSSWPGQDANEASPPPEYRKIFKEIFETLRKSSIHEEK